METGGRGRWFPWIPGALSLLVPAWLRRRRGSLSPAVPHRPAGPVARVARGDKQVIYPPLPRCISVSGLFELEMRTTDQYKITFELVAKKTASCGGRPLSCFQQTG